LGGEEGLLQRREAINNPTKTTETGCRQIWGEARIWTAMRVAREESARTSSVLLGRPEGEGVTASASRPRSYVHRMFGGTLFKLAKTRRLG